MDLTGFPRRRYTGGWTRLEKLEHFSAALGGPDIYIKRDDELGLTGGGNKTRKLEYIVADALAKGADTLITCGAVQSNHCRLTLAAAVKEGLQCRLVLAEASPGSYNPADNGNVFLYSLLGVEKITVVPWGCDFPAELEKAAAEAKSEGRTPYIIPMGGSDPLGMLGYADCAAEILAQAAQSDLAFSNIVLPVGSAGTIGGLLLGLHGAGQPVAVTGISVIQARSAIESLTAALIQETADYFGIDNPVPRAAIKCLDEYIGPGYTLPTPRMIEAVRLLAGTEGVLLDPSYTGKAMAGLVDLVRQGRWGKGDKVLFLHTGGIPGLYAKTAFFR